MKDFSRNEEIEGMEHLFISILYATSIDGLWNDDMGIFYYTNFSVIIIIVLFSIGHFTYHRRGMNSPRSNVETSIWIKLNKIDNTNKILQEFHIIICLKFINIFDIFQAPIILFCMFLILRLLKSYAYVISNFGYCSDYLSSYRWKILKF